MTITRVREWAVGEVGEVAAVVVVRPVTRQQPVAAVWAILRRPGVAVPRPRQLAVVEVDAVVRRRSQPVAVAVSRASGIAASRFRQTCRPILRAA